MSDIREEWFKLVLDELRKNNDKVDKIKDEVEDKISAMSSTISRRLDESSEQHKNLFIEQSKLSIEHERMNDLLAEHIKRTGIAEEHIELLKASIRPVVDDYNEAQVVSQYRVKKIKKVTFYLGAISACGGAAAYIMKLLEVF